MTAYKKKAMKRLASLFGTFEWLSYRPSKYPWNWHLITDDGQQVMFRASKGYGTIQICYRFGDDGDLYKSNRLAREDVLNAISGINNDATKAFRVWLEKAEDK